MTHVKQVSTDSDRENMTPIDVKDKCHYHKLSDFTVGKPLGRGRFGRVFMAVHKKEFLVAIKFLAKSELVKCNMEQQVVREIEIHNMLNHPNIVSFLAYFTDVRRIYLVFEYCFNGELYKFVQKQPNRVLDVTRTATYIYQAADALRYAHEKGVMHRDIKPENMLLGMYEEVKMSDFGWGVHDRRGNRRTMCGTLDYLPPEMVSRKNYDNKVDEWCLGILCYELLHGSPPFETNEEKCTKAKIAKCEYKFPSNMDKHAKDLISKILVYREERIVMADIIKHPFVTTYLSAKYFSPMDKRLPMLGLKPVERPLSPLSEKN